MGQGIENISNTSTIEAGNFKFQEDPRKLLALHTGDARKILIGPEAYRSHLDNHFMENSRGLYSFYEALQTSLSQAERKGEANYPNLQEVGRHLAIYKRSISDRSPMPSEDKILQIAMILAGQRLPFINILRKVVHNSKGIAFETNFVAPTESQTDKIIIAYKHIISQAHLVLKKIINSDFETAYLTMTNQSMQAKFKPEVRVGRVDHELRKIYIDEKVMGPIPQGYKAYVQRVNQELFMRVYRPLIVEGIQSKTLFSFNCDDMRTESNENFMQFYDIVHLASPKYLEKRYELLSEFLSPSYFQEWWDYDAQNSIKRSLDMAIITQIQYTQDLAKALFNGMRQRSDAAPSHLIHLTIELIKLAEWKSSHEKNVLQEKKQVELNSLLNTLQKVENIYRIRDKRWIKENIEVVLSLLRSKVPTILACTHPYANPFKINKNFDPIASKVDIYLILKNKKASANAIQAAEKLYRTNGDTTLLRVLENLFDYHSKSRTSLKEYIAPIYLNNFEECLSKCYLHCLPWFSQLYYTLFGKTLSKTQIARFKAKLDARDKRALEGLISTKPSHSLHSNTDQYKTSVGERATQKISPQRPQKDEISPEEKILFEKACRFLEEEWEKNRYPSRQNLIAMAGKEEALMRKILSWVTPDVRSAYPILSIEIYQRSYIYASRSYLRNKRTILIRNLSSKMQQEETYKIQKKTYLNINHKNRNLYKGIIEYLKKNPKI